MQETALALQDAKTLRRTTIGEGAAAALTAFASAFYGFASAAAWMHGNVFIGSGLAVFCGGTFLLHRVFLRSYRALRREGRNRPVFPAARIIRKSRL